jgi:protein CpxP
MLNTRAAALGAALLLGLSGIASAQAPARPGQVAPRQGPGMRRGGRFEDRFVKDLNLTAAQQAQIKTIRAKYRPQFDAIRQQVKTESERARALRQKGDTAASRAAFQKVRADVQLRTETIRKQEDAEIRAILTTEQRAKFDAAQAQRKQWMEKRRSGAPGKRGPGGYRGQRS